MHVPLIDIKAQNFTIKQLAAEKFSKIFDSSSFILGKEVEEFEKNIADYLGVRHAIGVSSGTDAILLALMALGVKSGDEVICPSLTFFATAGCVARLGARPVFVDVDTDDFNISITEIEKNFSPATKAIIPVHLFGQSAAIDEIVTLADRHGVAVVEDCAQSLGARRHGRQTGTFGAMGCFSFYPTKNLGGFGDSGLVCTNSDETAEKLKMLRVHGMKSQYFHKYVGGNFRIDELQAALLGLKLPLLNGYIHNRRAHAEFYLRELSGVGGIVLPCEKANNWHTWNQFTIRVLDGKRDQLMKFLQQRSVGCGIYYPLPLDAQECFKSVADHKEPTKNAKVLASEVLSLPVFPELSDEQRKFVVATVKEFFHQ